ncbi:MAG TPA: FAD:protein FMN transferase [Patescibacteria group bacterium]|nr:FAD:protein FMN transferase [Patescibacteria group bacterium]
MPIRVSRRRALTIFAAAAGLPLLPGLLRTARADEAQLFEWKGTAAGAAASISLYHTDKAQAQQLLAACTAEIARLEAIFSLYQTDSAVCRLNRDGHLDNPPLDLVQVLGLARSVSLASQGAFDPTVQPLWDLYAGHFAKPDADPNGPAESLIAAARDRVDFRKVAFDTTGIAFQGRDMGLTFNGIAQGYITDKVSDLLRSRGMTHVLVNLDSIRALGPHADGTPWTVGIADPKSPEGWLRTIDIVDKAVDTSGGYGTVFDALGRFNHLFIPQTGHSAHFHAGVTVIAETAAKADALSTTLSVVDPSRAEAIIKAVGGATAYFIDQNNVIATITA